MPLCYLAVPVLVAGGSRQAEIGAQVDHAHTRLRKAARRLDRFTVGQAQKDDVDLAGPFVCVGQSESADSPTAQHGHRTRRFPALFSLVIHPISNCGWRWIHCTSSTPV